ncbi:MAG: hypothetical protein Q6365_019170, partial [Candidatus Sigynarchaeota archaeon]
MMLFQETVSLTTVHARCSRHFKRRAGRALAAVAAFAIVAGLIQGAGSRVLRVLRGGGSGIA